MRGLLIEQTASAYRYPLPKGVYFSHRQLVLHTLAVRSALAGTGHEDLLLKHPEVVEAAVICRRGARAA